MTQLGMVLRASESTSVTIELNSANDNLI